MPDMDGIQFLIEVRAQFGKVPFILFTGRGREEVVTLAINNGADFYLQKGGNPDAQFAWAFTSYPDDSSAENRFKSVKS